MEFLQQGFTLILITWNKVHLTDFSLFSVCVVIVASSKEYTNYAFPPPSLPLSITTWQF